MLVIMDKLIRINLLVKDNTPHWLKTNNTYSKSVTMYYKSTNSTNTGSTSKLTFQDQQRPVKIYD